MKREANFQIYFNKWVRMYFQKTAVFELKHAINNRLAFDRLEKHQKDSLWASKHSYLKFKIPDCGFQNPFDLVTLKCVPAYVVIKYTDFFCLIDIDQFIEAEKESEEKSLTADKARDIAEYCVNINL